jgi:hypothetical protein
MNRTRWRGSCYPSWGRSPREREIIREYVVAGVQDGQGQREAVGAARRVFRRDEAVGLREGGMSWRKIAAELRVPVTTVVEGCR